VSQRLAVYAAVLGVAAVIVVGAGIVVLTTDARPRGELSSATLLQQPRPLAAFQLVDQHGNATTRSAFEGRWSIVFAGFTHCPDACPATLGLLRTLDARLRASQIELQTVFLSVDPERDTPEQLAAYLHFFDGRIVALTGTKPQIDVLTDSLGLAYIKVPGAHGTYTVDHSTALVLIDPDARVAGYVIPPLDLEAMTTDMRRLLTGR
jgi:protein SCO1